MARRTKAEAEATRGQILDAAERVFYDKGVAHASLEDIAAAWRAWAANDDAWFAVLHGEILGRG